MEIKNTDVFGFGAAIRGMRNPMNSWNKSDSRGNKIGAEDMKLCQRLIKAGPEHSKFMRMIHVQADITAPRGLWQEIDTYKFVEKNSCSTMHRLLNTSKPITLNLFDYAKEDRYAMDVIIKRLEKLRAEFNDIKKSDSVNKAAEMNAILIRAKKLLPESFLQLRTIDTNYAELRNMYFQRRNHKLPEWHEICHWIESLPYAKELITYEGDDAGGSD